MAFTLRLKRPDEKESTLYVEFKMNNQRFKFYPGKTIHTRNWSAKRQEVLQGEENYKLINDHLDRWKSELKRILQDMEAKKQMPTRESVQLELDKVFKPETVAKGVEQPVVHDFISFIESYI